MGLTVDWKWLRKESLSQRIYSIKSSETKSKENKDKKKKKEQAIQGLRDNYKRYNWNTRRKIKREKNRRNI